MKTEKKYSPLSLLNITEVVNVLQDAGEPINYARMARIMNGKAQFRHHDISKIEVIIDKLGNILTSFIVANRDTNVFEGINIMPLLSKLASDQYELSNLINELRAKYQE